MANTFIRDSFDAEMMYTVRCLPSREMMGIKFNHPSAEEKAEISSSVTSEATGETMLEGSVTSY